MSQPQESDRQSSSSKTGSLLAPPSLRPRAKRLISGLDEFPSFEDDDGPANGGAANGGLGSPYHSRAASPIPSKHPSRSSSNRAGGNSFSNNSSPNHTRGNAGADYGNDLAASLSGLWGKSWTNIQSIASNVLGSDATQELYKDKAAAAAATSQRQRRPYEATHPKDRTPATWGPRSRDANANQPGGGSREERAAKVRAEKRKELLAQSGSYGDARSKTKRRTSDDFESASAPPSEHDDRDALVYIHRVEAKDTLAGISIKYNTHMAVIKKSNRLWSNDAVQFRATLMLPIDSCGIRGRPVAAPDGSATTTGDLLGATDGDDGSGNGNGNGNDADATPRPDQGQFPTRRNDSVVTIKPGMDEAGHSRQNSSHSATAREENAWKHDAWVLLEGHSVATEIGRIPRRELGYFPRGRRKSMAYSDLDTPSTSLDLSRASVAPSVAPSEASSARGPGHRRSSSAAKWAQQMMGPGGVGKLNSKGVSVPGPALDKLNKTFSKPFANLAGGEPELPPALQSLGGTIEGWMRNLSKTAARLVDAPPPAQRLVRRQTGIQSGAGDLIELDNSFEQLGDGDDGDDEHLPDPSEFSDDADRGRSRGSTMVSEHGGGGGRMMANATTAFPALNRKGN